MYMIYTFLYIYIKNILVCFEKGNKWAVIQGVCDSRAESVFAVFTSRFYNLQGLLLHLLNQVKVFPLS